MTNTKDIYEMLGYLMKRVDMIAESLGDDTKLMTVTDVAAYYGKPRSSMYANNRWLLPNYGFAEDGCTSVNEWTRAEVFAWNSKPVETRKAELKTRIFPIKKG